MNMGIFADKILIMFFLILSKICNKKSEYPKSCN